MEFGKRRNHSSFIFTKWQHAIACLFLAGDTKISLSLGSQGPHITQCVVGPHNCTYQWHLHCVSIKSGPQNKKLQCNKNIDFV